MAFMDEEIIAKRNEAMEKSKHNIANEVIIDGESYTFSQQQLFDGMVSIVLPEQFVDMDPEMIKHKYPSIQQPNTIKCSKDGNINMVFQILAQSSTESVEVQLKGMQSAIKRVNPANVFYSFVPFELESKLEAGYFDFMSYTVDEDLYNLFFLVRMETWLLIGTFNCPHEQKDDWKDLAVQMLQTVCISQTDENEKADMMGGI